MTTEINPYHTSKIYRISSPQCDKFYIGSTTQTIKARLSKHKAAYKRYLEKGLGKYLTSFEVVKFDDAIIELIKNVKCENRKELEKVEGDCIKEHHDRILNRYVAGRTMREWRETNKNKIHEQCKEYNEKHKDKIKEKYKEYYETHKNEIIEQKKEYYEAHKNEILDKLKEYYKTHNNEVKEYKKEYYEAHKNEIKEYNEARKEKLNEKFDCDCGGKYIFKHKSQHKKSQRHIDFINLSS